jgi:hypothetical protein
VVSFLLPFPPKSCMHSFSLSHTCYVPWPSHPPWLDHSNYIWRTIQVMKPITMAARSKAWTVCGCSNAGIVGSNSTRGMDVSVSLFCVCVVLRVGSGLETGWSPVQGDISTVLGLRNWSERKCFTDALCSKWEIQERERKKERGTSYEAPYYAFCFSFLLFQSLLAAP